MIGSSTRGVILLFELSERFIFFSDHLFYSMLNYKIKMNICYQTIDLYKKKSSLTFRGPNSIRRSFRFVAFQTRPSSCLNRIDDAT